jgi:hypothetical protein
MRNRHIPRVCRHCDAPMASGAGTCWRCGVEWASEDGPATTLRLVRSARSDEVRDATPAVPPPPRVAVAALVRS